MCAACRRGRVKPHRGLDAAEELQPKLLLLLNRQMFVQGFDTENRPAILLLLLSSLNLLKEKDLLKRDRKLFPAKGKVAQGI